MREPVSVRRKKRSGEKNTMVSLKVIKLEYDRRLVDAEDRLRSEDFVSEGRIFKDCEETGVKREEKSRQRDERQHAITESCI